MLIKHTRFSSGNNNDPNWGAIILITAIVAGMLIITFTPMKPEINSSTSKKNENEKL